MSHTEYADCCGRPRHPKVKFYKSLRSFLTFNVIIFVLCILGGSWGLFKISAIWGLVLFARYIKIFGWPGSNGWLGGEWEEWMQHRERTRYHQPSNNPADSVDWKDRDLV